MFGPDLCGYSERVHLILNRKGTNHLIAPEISLELNTFTKVYTVVLNPDNTVQYYLDGSLVTEGKIDEKFPNVLPPKKINDPSQSKPADWVDEAMIDDPEDKKPEGYDDIPAQIVDPDAKKPDDWDSELDGEWEAPTIPNPEFKGAWKAKRIDNPLYKGPWVHPQIDNPEFQEDSELYLFKSWGGVGIEIWQVESGSVFDNILVTDSLEEAEAARKPILLRKDQESALKDAEDKAAADAAAAEKKDEDKDDKDEKKDDEDKEDL